MKWWYWRGREVNGCHKHLRGGITRADVCFKKQESDKSLGLQKWIDYGLFTEKGVEVKVDQKCTNNYSYLCLK